MTYKLIKRCPETKIQSKKWIYDTTDKFNKFSPDIVKRHREPSWDKNVGSDIEVYKMIDEKYELVEIHKALRR